ncbi:MAG: cysteine methyltransferase [Sulfuricurvum sp. PD_MW2]|jgi:methylated-DNA-[protein]-cysteine S-methyltransferase|uniref:methylated-DNA--[protein]-cysteine S-methyltransferase n=1 Tax=Sulfuricurvum sp. PD_MW2 TaxID=2027917 RepID=UPI000C063F85|nr:methylated-DNA--[protein]-cysteine S-methyltransferase [Sulfuricurvum sp. PD_MW2]PHM16672.1 MAG: cysteine methyltransferase [Sulfuricurvum sp. PD_MW2]
MKIHTRIIYTPLGNMIATANESAITSLDFTDEAIRVENDGTPLLIQLEKELKNYFEGKLHTFTLPLAPQGTPFQEAVWKTLCSISYGETISYAREAALFGNPKAIRAVASANGRNPIAILIPCHRVIASDGTLGGYSGGLDKKEFLLRLEGKYFL